MFGCASTQRSVKQDNNNRQVASILGDIQKRLFSPGSCVDLTRQILPLFDTFQQATMETLAERYDLFIAKQNAHPTVSFLENLGFVFDENSKTILVPTEVQIAHRYDVLVDDLIKSKKISSDESIRLRKVSSDFANSDGVNVQFDVFELGSVPKKGHSAFDLLLNDQAWLQMLAKGYLAFGETRIVGNAYQEVSIALHDLGHAAGLVHHPKYMAEVRRGAKRLVEGGTFRDGMLPTNVRSRVFLTTEVLSLPKAGIQKKLKEDLWLPEEPVNRRFYTVEEVEEYLKSFSSKELRDHASWLRTHLPSQIDVIGGSVADLSTASPSGSNIGSWKESLVFLVNELSEVSSRREIAEVQVAMFELSGLSPDEFARYALQIDIDQNSKFYQIICLTGIFNNIRSDTGHYSAFCK